MPLAAIAAGVIVALGAGAFIALRPRPAAHPVAKTAVARPAAAKVLPQPIVAAIPAGNTAVTATTGSSDPAAQKKAFEAAVAQKLQEEMMKLQSDLNKQLKQQQSKNAPVQMASMISTPAQQQTDDRGAAAALDQRRLASRQETPAAVAQSAPQQSAAPLLTQQQTAPQVTQTQAPVSTIHEGDVVDVTELDRLPEPLAPIRPTYPQMALQQRLQTTVILSALISENGDVIEVKILRGDTRFGFNDAAVRALRGARFSAPMKDGKRVKTWRPQTIAFRM
jgi:TonB family protein